ncbi:hypothetical protein [Paraclostridium sordellii]|uniref:Uncharacterized protein n=1 Tax=Paraclostridium sordellii TaxID=1505 RepID=A0A0C7G3F0_PARSO|nr:hypothetical protein [Paeniclostridium sordellii]CEN77883.1 Uncharacterised protein [[Clostridium] sordellii] [Paeniclostridium sordellii]CEQ02973.1 Uncharacterised protein [[Clostridium] sordellii] [Paeniclostridium sordellii]
MDSLKNQSDRGHGYYKKKVKKRTNASVSGASVSGSGVSVSQSGVSASASYSKPYSE